MVRQIIQMIVIDTVLVLIFYLITFFFLNNETRMGEDDFQPIDNADNGQLDIAGADKDIGNIKIAEADLPAFKRKLKEAIRQ